MKLFNITNIGNLKESTEFSLTGKLVWKYEDEKEEEEVVFKEKLPQIVRL